MERTFFMICGIIILVLHVGCATSVPVNVSINGLYFSDVGCDATKWRAGWDWPGVFAGEFEFRIVGINTTIDIKRDTQEIKSTNEFNIPLSDVKYLNINETVISGWPAVLGILEKKNGEHELVAFVYVNGVRIRIEPDVAVNKEKYNYTTFQESVNRIKITLDPNSNLSTGLGLSDQGSRLSMIPYNVSLNGLYIEPGDFAEPIQRSYWLSEELYLDPLLINLELQNKEYHSWDDVDWSTLNETTISGWPAAIGVVNTSKEYVSGSVPLGAPLPEIQTDAIIKVGRLKLRVHHVVHLNLVNGIYKNSVDPEELANKMRRIKITLAPGAEEIWNTLLERCYHGDCL